MITTHLWAFFFESAQSPLSVEESSTFGGSPLASLPLSGAPSLAGSVAVSAGVATAQAVPLTSAQSVAASSGSSTAQALSGGSASSAAFGLAEARSGSLAASLGAATAQGVSPVIGNVASASGLGAAQALSGSLFSVAGTAAAQAGTGSVAASGGLSQATGVPVEPVGPKPGIYGDTRKKRVIPYLETPAKRRDPRRAAGQAGERAPPPATLPADTTPTPRDRLADILRMPIMQKGALEAPLWWRELLERARATEERLALEAALEAARIEAERRAEAERFVDAVRALARGVVERGYPEAERVMREALAEADRAAPQAQALFDEYQKNRRRKERAEERFVIRAAMELLN